MKNISKTYINGDKIITVQNELRDGLIFARAKSRTIRNEK